MADEDRLIAAEFLSELSALEQRVFRLLAEGLGSRATAQRLGIAGKDARSASRACERKRDRFVVLYESGRLCGFRAHTIRSLQSGQVDSGELARRAYIHLQGCARCRQEHETSGREFRRLFDNETAALLPVPILAACGHGVRARLGGLLARHHELVGARAGGGSVREQVVGVVASAGAAAKLATGVATVAVMAGGAVGVEHALSPSRRSPPIHAARHHRADARGRGGMVAMAKAAPAPAGGLHRGAEGPAAAALGARRLSRQPGSSGSQGSGQPGGFSYLGASVAGQRTPPRAVAAASSRPLSTQRQASGSGHAPGGGGLFSP